MDKSFVARQPILDREEKLIGYELLFREGLNNAFPDIDPVRATSKVLSNVYFKSDSYEHVIQDKVGYVNFPYQSLVTLVPALLPKEKIVIEVLEDCKPTDELLVAIKHLKSLGYTIALDDFVPTPEWKRFLRFIDIIKFDISVIPLNKAANLIKKLGERISFVAERVETREQFLQCKELGFHYFQGYYFAKPEIIEQKAISASQLSVIKLCQEVAKEEIQIKRLEALFATDVALSYKLFRYVNSSNLSAPIRSFRQALAYLGENKIRLFVSLVALSSDSESGPKPIYHMAIQRAYFCSLIAKELNLARSDAYIVGLFSLLDSIFKVSYDTIFQSVKVSDLVTEAILEHKGVLGTVLRLVESYEKADWDSITSLNEELQLCPHVSSRCFTSSLKWDQPSDKASLAA
ncbi:EAL and HDOD domain-containing protein [Vibrio sp. 16]|uniref:EAL and HDOD domain-containing protein n=2 Tax=Vibrio sp. 16 TaxID=391586 RepID=UPI002ACC067C|nr:EAL domain-containing protein [Vibrio sp. 16]CAK4075452.1 Cyclic di-GMP phosphodiesterase CdgJ [Vibrio sp. 16]